MVGKSSSQQVRSAAEYLGGLLGFRQTRLYQVLEPLKEHGMVDVAALEGSRYLALTDRGWRCWPAGTGPPSARPASGGALSRWIRKRP